MSETDLIRLLNQGPVEFSQVMAVIDGHYDFTPTAFKNGAQENAANSNNGSCKIFAFAKRHQLSAQATLHAFGAYYTEDVLKHPDATDHQNIRQFMQQGWEGIQFAGEALQPKS